MIICEMSATELICTDHAILKIILTAHSDLGVNMGIIICRAMTNSRSFGYESNFNEIRICFQNSNIRSRHATLLQRDT